MPILGIIASSKLSAVGDFESIATVTVGVTPVSTITFSSIPATFNHLQIRALSRNSRADANSATLKVQVNGVGASSYTYSRFIGDGSSIIANAFGPDSAMYFYGASPSAPTPTDTFGAVIFDILDYANTNKNTTFRQLSGYETNSEGAAALGSGGFFNTDAISSITIQFDGGYNHLQYSHFALYGIKGA
jgi:hypothetical protein